MKRIVKHLGGWLGCIAITVALPYLAILLSESVDNIYPTGPLRHRLAWLIMEPYMLIEPIHDALSQTAFYRSLPHSIDAILWFLMCGTALYLACLTAFLILKALKFRK